MTQEEKAKRYDEALERMKSWARGEHPECFTEAQKAAEFIFPELAESMDEKIRKVLVELVKGNERCGYFMINNITTSAMLAWLEKKGESKLAGCEDDRIRKWLVDTIKQIPDSSIEWETISKSDVLDWLEKQREKPKKVSIWKHWKDGIAGNGDGEQTYLIKVGNIYDISSCLGCECDYIELSELDNLLQGEQKETLCDKCKKDGMNTDNKIEPKFKIGDFIANDYCVGKVIALTDDAYLLDTGQGIPFSCEYNAHLWTIDDARNGDVLMFEGYYNSIVLFQGVGINGVGRINYHCKCDLGNYSFNIQGDTAYMGTVQQDGNKYRPATKEQRDLLFSKMHEAGYIWDAESKQILLLKAEPTEEIRGNNGGISPKWTDEDEKCIDNCCLLIGAADDCYEKTFKDDCIHYLQSLKERMEQ